VALFSSVSVALPAAVLGFTCSTSNLYFMGTEEYHGTTRGAEVKIAFVNESLCTSPPPIGTFSSYWVSVVGGGLSPNNIYQIGVDKCKGGACSGGNPSNTPYYFWAYGHETSATCGPALEPIPHLITGTPSGLRTYTIVPEAGPGGNLTRAKIDGVPKATIAESSLMTCWTGGIIGVQIENELLDSATQGGGPTSNFQDFQTPKWYDSSWHTISRAPGTICDTPPTPARRCQWSTVTPNTWKSWDTRF
jgi:hypothetical protein